MQAHRPTHLPRFPQRAADIPLPHQDDCGCARPDPDAIDTVRERLRLAWDTARSMGLHVIDVHVCELRQLATWGIAPRPEDLPLYFYPWKIDDADPVFALTVPELRQAIAALDALRAPPPAPRPPATPRFGSSLGRLFA